MLAAPMIVDPKAIRERRLTWMWPTDTDDSNGRAASQLDTQRMAKGTPYGNNAGVTPRRSTG